MSDLVFGLIIMTLLCVALFCLGLRMGRLHSKAATRIFAVLTVLAVFAYTAFLWNSPNLVVLLPFSNLIVTGNWFPPAAAFLGGLVFDLLPVSRRRSTECLLIGASAFCLVYPLLGTAPQCHETYDSDGRCIQSTDATCSAACAASLLRSHGIWATEQEMAELCLTRQGTQWQGLYRGLKTKTRDTNWDVEVVTCPAEQLRYYPGELILTVGLDPAQEGADELVQEFGWDSNVWHSVIQIGTDPQGNPLIFDPSPGYGKERWLASQLGTLYRGHALRLVPRTDESRLSGVVSALSRSY